MSVIICFTLYVYQYLDFSQKMCMHKFLYVGFFSSSNHYYHHNGAVHFNTQDDIL